MGQTLTHGIYLPDEGERNCYSGLAANWQLLDSSVGTIAEHTSALSEKAPLVHTHSKADITDFPALATVATSGSYNDLSNIPASFTPASHTHGNITNDGKVGTTADKPLITGTGGVVQAGSFGNQANTFCEGNDSRLSDARTPVAHTHTKSDVTDLFNSDFIPSANNSYNLGSSTYQWNNLYAKNYYYNGVAWGLDKGNVWTGANTFRQNITYERTNFFHQAVNPCYFLKDTGVEKGSLTPTPHSAYVGNWQDKNNAYLGYMRFVAYDTGKQTVEIRVSNLIKNGALDPTGSTVNCTINLELQPSGEKSLIPEQNNDINLGTTTNKWKTLNGINPGALSLPSASYIDISSSITDRNYGANYYTAPSNGYVCIGSMASSLQISNDTLGFGISAGTAQDGYSSVYIPVRTGDTVRILLNQTSTDYQTFRFYSCQGNV